MKWSTFFFIITLMILVVIAAYVKFHIIPNWNASHEQIQGQ